jgi:uncharacterized membrane protein YraQ (UPF0718 family)
MPDSAVVLWGIAGILGILVARRDRMQFVDAMRSSLLTLISVLPRLCVAMILAGFIAKLIPSETIGHLIGYDTGWRGIALATLFGGLMPSGPMVAFPVVVVLRNADAGLPQIVAFLTAWSVFAWHRVLTYEVAILGWRFVTIRLMSSIVLPLVASLVAMVICEVMGLR